MAQQQNNDNQMWLRKEARDLFTRVVNTIIMRGEENKLPDADKICDVAKKITDKAFENYPEPEEETKTDKNEFEA